MGLEIDGAVQQAPHRSRQFMRLRSRRDSTRVKPCNFPRPSQFLLRHMAKEHELLKVALDELRMQMLGSQVLFGFQFDALFQERFQDLAGPAKAAAGVGFVFIVATLALLITAPSIHRIALQGEATPRMRRIAASLAELALVTLAITLACDVFMVTQLQFGTRVALWCAMATLMGAAVLWYGIGLPSRLRRSSGRA
jgi:hypothetical protein